MPEKLIKKYVQIGGLHNSVLHKKSVKTSLFTRIISICKIIRFPFSTNIIAHSSAQSVGNPCTLKCEELLWVKNSEIIWIVNLEFLRRQNGNQRFYNIVSNDSCILFMELLLEEEKTIVCVFPQKQILKRWATMKKSRGGLIV